MTVQIGDRLIYNKDTFGILRASEESIFNPADYGIKTAPISSACWRGFHCTYKIHKNFLKLEELYLGLDYLDKKRLQLGKFHKLFGKVLELYEDKKTFSPDYRYGNLNRYLKLLYIKINIS